MKRINRYNGELNVLSKLIRENRISEDLSQEMLAARMQLKGISISRNEISRLETGKRLIKDFELIALKDILKLDLNSIHLEDL